MSWVPQKRCLISRAEIARRVAELAERIGRDYAGRDLVMVGVLKGVFIFMADLVRALPFPVEVDFVRLWSYGAGTTTSGEVQITKDVEMSLKDRDVLIVEDIVDTGPHPGLSASSTCPATSPAPSRSAASSTSKSAGKWRSPWITSALWWKRAFWWATAWTAANRAAPCRKFLCWKRIESRKDSSALQASPSMHISAP